jgi:hypothetical protein
MIISTNRSTNSNPSNSIKGITFEKNVQSAFSSFLPLKEITLDFMKLDNKFYFSEMVVKILSEKLGLNNLEPIDSFDFTLDVEEEKEIFLKNDRSYLIKYKNNCLTLTNKFYKTETIIKLKDKPCNFDGYVWKINIREKIITLKVFNECKILNNF